jgi:hypothetical protein
MPVDQVPEDTSTEASRLLWIFENHNSARILFQFNGHDKFLGEAKGFDINLQLAGVAFSDGAFRSLVFEDEQGRRYLLVQNSEDSKYQSCSLRALPVGLSGPLEDRTIEIEMDDVYEPIPVEDKDIVGIIYCNLRVAEDDTYDLCEPFPPDEKLWTGYVQQINVKTGKEIMGPQDFPDVVEPDGTLFIMNKGVISSFDREVLNGTAECFVMEGTNSIQITSDLDLLRYRAIAKATDNRSGDKKNCLTGLTR